MSENSNAFLAGKELYGDNFTPEQLAVWYEAEKEGYAGIVSERNEDYKYKYHEMNIFYGYRHITLPPRAEVLGLGSAYCEEFRPIIDQIGKITAVEPSEKLFIRTIENVPVNYLKPTVTGAIPLEDNSFDLVTSFGVLHHIANVSFVLGECYRCLRPGGVMLLREPIVSMGDWRVPRRGLTKNERGIPIELMKAFAKRSGFTIERISLLDFSPYIRAMSKLRYDVFLSKWMTVSDFILCKLFSFNKKYHRVRVVDKFGPATTYMILRKR